ncbi:MAG: hypothetical protein ACNA7K_01665 [Acholeplasmataceae bacterium]
MWKWVGRSFYIIFIIFVTAWVYSAAYFSKLQAYYDDHIRDNINDSVIFLEGVNTLLQTDYFRESPLLFSYTQDEGDFQLNVSIYAVSATEDNVRNDGFIIFVNQVSVKHDDEILTQPVLKITVGLDSETLLVNGEPSREGTVQYVPSDPFAFSNLPTVFLFDNDRFLRNSETGDIAELESIAVYYSDGSLDQDNRYVYESRPIFLATKTPSDEIVLGNNKVGDLLIDQSLYQLRNDFSGAFPNEAEIASFNLNTNRESLNDYNFLVWRSMGIYLLFVSGLTYFLFFHKYVKLLRAKKIEQNTPTNQSADVIFKD